MYNINVNGNKKVIRHRMGMVKESRKALDKLISENMLDGHPVLAQQRSLTITESPPLCFWSRFRLWLQKSDRHFIIIEVTG